jgi:hypothetical protein
MTTQELRAPMEVAVLLVILVSTAILSIVEVECVARASSRPLLARTRTTATAIRQKAPILRLLTFIVRELRDTFTG